MILIIDKKCCKDTVVSLFSHRGSFNVTTTISLKIQGNPQKMRLQSSAQDPINFDADPDPGSVLKKNRSGSGSKSGYFFSLIFMLKLDEPFRNQEIFIISLFLIVQIWVLRVDLFCCSFWLIFCPLDSDPLIRIFLRIRIQEAKILRIQRIRIRILSTALETIVRN